MMSLGLRGLVLLLAVILFIVGALSDNETKQDLLFWGLAVFAASFIVDSLPIGNMMGKRDRDRT
jgi:predicted cobalt transporter CbtA